MSRFKKLSTAQEYAEALERIADRGIAPVRKRMLLTHYAMPGHLATARHLAAAVRRNYTHAFANMQYGGLAGQVYRALRLRYHGDKLWTLATWPESPVDSRGEFSFRMRPEVVRAIELLGWNKNLPRVPKPARPPRSAIEGELVAHLRHHRTRERGLREAKIADVSSRSKDGRLRCEIKGCGFDFEERFGELGRGYIQVHHLGALARRRGARVTTLDQLILVCANCHAMIHRGGANRPPTELRAR